MVLDLPGLSPRIMTNPENYPNIKRLADMGLQRSVWPTFPAVTCSIQASIITGTPPSKHGMIANGLFDRQRYTVDFWAQSHRLVAGEKIWDSIREIDSKAKSGVICFQNTMFAHCDMMLTPAPIHTHGDKMLSSCYTKPAALYHELAKDLGDFNLMNYWGPMASLPSSQWITKAAIKMWQENDLNLLLVYLPHLDYCLQKFGPDAPEIQRELKDLDRLVGNIVMEVGLSGDIVVLSEYGMTPVTGAVEINRILRRGGYIAVREVGGMEYLDYGMSRAFAMVDHQVAHIYFNELHDIPHVKAELEKVQGIEHVLDDLGKREYQIDHPNAGELVVLSAPDKWFSYQWWLDQKKAPDFAHTVDIHRKPGYDPQELFFDPATKGISQDSSLVKGSHGLVPENEQDLPVLIVPKKKRKTKMGDGLITSTDIKAILLDLLHE